MIAPKVPGGGSIGQAVFDHQSDGQGDDAASVMAARWGQVGQVGTEENIAGGAVMLGVNHVENARPVPKEAAEVVQRAMATSVSVTRTMTSWATSAAVGSRPSLVEGRRKVFNTSNPCGAVWDVRARCHERLLLPAKQTMTVEPKSVR